MKFICQNKLCGLEFHDRFHAGRKFCSPDCGNATRRKVDINRLSQLVFRGETKADIAREFGVHYKTVLRWISDYGLEHTWREQRYA